MRLELITRAGSRRSLMAKAVLIITIVMIFQRQWINVVLWKILGFLSLGLFMNTSESYSQKVAIKSIISTIQPSFPHLRSHCSYIVVRFKWCNVGRPRFNSYVMRRPSYIQSIGTLYIRCSIEKNDRVEVWSYSNCTMDFGLHIL